MEEKRGRGNPRIKKKHENISFKVYPETKEDIKKIQKKAKLQTGLTLKMAVILQVGVFMLSDMKIESVFDEIKKFNKSID
jgi:hypothetical protein